MNNVIQFPAETVEHYPIDYYPNSHAVDFQVIPHDVTAAVCILDRIMADLIDHNVLDEDSIALIYLNVTGQLKPTLLKEEDQ